MFRKWLKTISINFLLALNNILKFGYLQFQKVGVCGSAKSNRRMLTSAFNKEAETGSYIASTLQAYCHELGLRSISKKI